VFFLFSVEFMVGLGLAQLANQAKQLAKQDATELVQRFGELGRRKFNLAA
jgi:hypothetical protein